MNAIHRPSGDHAGLMIPRRIGGQPQRFARADELYINIMVAPAIGFAFESDLVPVRRERGTQLVPR